METTWVGNIVAVATVLALIGLNGFFVAAEFALVAIRRTKVEEMVAQGVSRARSVSLATENLDRTIAATQLGITLASIALGWIGEPTIAHLVEPTFAGLPGMFRVVGTHTLATAIAFLLITLMHVVFGELIPKSVALQLPEKTSLIVSSPLNVFAQITAPVISLMNGLGFVILRLFGFQSVSSEESVHSIEELRLLIEDTEEAGLIDEDQAAFLQNVFMLSGKRVSDCMVPREKMAALDVNSTPEKVMEEVRAGAHTRMPVFDGDIDHVVGIVNTKDLFYLFSLSGIIVLDDAIYPATFLDESETVANALRLLKKSRRPMALVKNSEGKIAGLITLEDVLEEIVGDIEDEHDRPMPKLVIRRRRGSKS